MKLSMPLFIADQNTINLELLRRVLQELFREPDPANISAKVSTFLLEHPLSIWAFPRQKNNYSKTILYREKNGYEAMAARWPSGAISSIHGHPPFLFYYVIKGSLKIDNYRRNGTKIIPDSSEFLRETDHFFSIGRPGRFDNNIHQVQANEETLSLHISSDDSTKGEIFSRTQDMVLEY